ncbi:Alpha/Beta hydrolase protein [Leptodontidium sp. MPI-SDFR-AT-0119]|nr:Alpha/Beta hydrolase protein [Leptodontidium sp. MPI-SDFR-AT-0119]
MSEPFSGHFLDGPFVGLSYRTPTQSGVTNSEGRFAYKEGEVVTFSIDALTLGHAKGNPSLTLASLYETPPNADQNQQDTEKGLTRPDIVNRARFVQSLGPDGDLRDGVTVDGATRTSVGQNANDISFAVDVESFEKNAAVQAVLTRLGRGLRGAAAARNHIRRRLHGVRVLRDVKIPTRDGSYVVADVFLPLAGGSHPTLLHQGVYGRAFRTGSSHTAADRQASEQREADYYENVEARGQIYEYFRYSESAVAANSFDWVPRGYALVRVDSRGVGQSPGILAPFSPQEAQDYYDAIEWAAQQTWSNGKVGLWGASYNATIQWPVASVQPPSLKAFAPQACDTDGYRDLAYPGGILLEGYRRWWWNNMAAGPSKNPKADAVDFLGGLARHPFDDSHYHGGTHLGIAQVDFSRIQIPVIVSASQTAWIHGRAGFEAFVRVPSAHKQLLVYDATYTYNLYHDFRSDLEVFFDHHLKGIKPDKEPPAVRIVMRTGHGKYEIKDVAHWPIPGTVYRELFLDAGAGIEVPGILTAETPARGSQAEYSADVTAAAAGRDLPMAVFETNPFSEDVELAGHFRATLWVSSTTADADVFVAFRVMDGDLEVQYRTSKLDSVAPISSGLLRASHRKTDPKLSTTERPWHTHTEEDYAPLLPNVPVKLDIESLAATARISTGHRLRIEITPADDGQGNPSEWSRHVDASYHAGAVNRILTGGQYPSSVTIPVVPRFT